MVIASEHYAKNNSNTPKKALETVTQGTRLVKGLIRIRHFRCLCRTKTQLLPEEFLLHLLHSTGNMGKVHGSLARAGKVRGQTPKVPKQEKKKRPRGRAMKRMKYNRRFVNVVVGFGKKRGPNSNPA